MGSSVPWVWSLVLAALFSNSATSKALDLSGLDNVLRSTLNLRGLGSRRLAVAITSVEFALAAICAVVSYLDRGYVVYFAAALILLTAFTVWVLRTMRRGYSVSCQCFGSQSGSVGMATVVRNGSLIAATMIALGVELSVSPGASVPNASSRIVFAATFISVAAALAAYQFARPSLAVPERSSAARTDL